MVLQGASFEQDENGLRLSGRQAEKACNGVDVIKVLQALVMRVTEIWMVRYGRNWYHKMRRRGSLEQAARICAENRSPSDEVCSVPVCLCMGEGLHGNAISQAGDLIGLLDHIENIA